MPSNSLWLMEKRQSFMSLTEEKNAEVVIVGAGIAGLTTAYYLAKAGIKVIVLEAKTIGDGTTGHTTGHITSQHDLTYDRWVKRFGFDTAKSIAKANEDAIKAIANIINDEKISCDFISLNSYVFTNDEAKIKKIINEAKVASKLGISAKFTREDNFILKYKGAVRFDNQAMFHPIKYLNGLANALLKYGGEIYENSRVLHIKGSGVETATGKINAGKIVIATHNPIINFSGMYFAKMYAHRAYVLAIENAPKVDGMWVSADVKGHTFRMQDDKLIVCGQDHKCGTQRNINHYEQLKKFTDNYFSSSTIVNQWSAQDGITLDNLPYIGRYFNGTDNLFVATGFGKWGMTQGTLSGMILSDLIMKNENPYSQIFSPQRKIVPFSICNAVYQNTATMVHYISGLTRINCPKCAHLKCKLTWNSDELSWDCPCHGSRYDRNGIVIDSPAIHDIVKNNNYGY